MTELFQSISEELRNDAETAWKLALTLSAPRAADFLSAYTSYRHSKEEQEFLNFYFSLQMEKLKNE